MLTPAPVFAPGPGFRATALIPSTTPVKIPVAATLAAGITQGFRPRGAPTSCLLSVGRDEDAYDEDDAYGEDDEDFPASSFFAPSIRVRVFRVRSRSLGSVSISM